VNPVGCIPANQITGFPFKGVGVTHSVNWKLYIKNDKTRLLQGPRPPGPGPGGTGLQNGRAYAAFLNPGRVPLGWNRRTSSLPLAVAHAASLTESGVGFLDLDLCGTEQVYLYTVHMKLGGGIMVTASQKLPVYNGLKFVREGSRPLSGDSGLGEIEAVAADGSFTAPGRTPGSGGANRSLRGLPRPPP
jgi:hypothetical protein